jgi:SAM-dependent methyltransferase
VRPELFALHADIEERHWWFTGRRQIMRALVARVLPPVNSPLVVDVGCGTGSNIASLSDAYRCMGVDTSDAAIELAKARFPSVEFRLGLAPEILGDAAGRADLFMMMDVLEHIEDDYSALSSLLAAAKPGALFYLTVPANMALWTQHDVSFGHYRRYDPARFRRVWQGLPVTELLLSHYSARLYPVIRAVREVSRLRNKPFGDNDTDLAIPAPPLNEMLRALFAGEASRLARVLDGRSHAYPFGSSLVAILRRDAGQIAPRARPAGER